MDSYLFIHLQFGATLYISYFEIFQYITLIHIYIHLLTLPYRPPPPGAIRRIRHVSPVVFFFLKKNQRLLHYTTNTNGCTIAVPYHPLSKTLALQFDMHRNVILLGIFATVRSP